MRNLLLILFMIPLLANCQSEKNALSKYAANVGDIAFNQDTDGSDFKRCLSDDFTFQYYNDLKGFLYKGEKIEIERKLAALKLQDDRTENGYITIRFIVNCEGKTGLFRVQQMNENYQKFAFDKKFGDQLLKFTEKLDGWIPKEYEGRKLDYYQYLTFKIENGKVSEILP
ncbi:hypothetical protein IV494_10465 [Kaistella sp. G5-32]|uniref:TonB C-terminal domain-containing protein n=1 Tax=Kaistella gelatinilytica TaxID=2787636 RepID=A0ABS0FD11_9FLAO|nr:hypothetical protein [Kaistella gelatinilytica]MBF8457601.1 hypothetical protein [Kaistella gelatinilytica]